jgi:hypothetical protein
MRGLAAIAFVGLACSPPTPGADAGTDAAVEISPVELCDRLAAARCGLTARCFAAFAGDPDAECRAAEQTQCLAEYESLKPSFEAGKLAIDPGQLSGCEKRMQTSSCPPSFPPDYPAITARAFSDCGLQSGLLKGSVAAGQTCDALVECSPGTVCVKQGGVCKGICSSWPLQGEPCAFGCAPGLFCDDRGTPTDPNDDRCGAPRALNEPCLESFECQPDLVCNGTCRPRGKLNEACRFDDSRLSTCEPGLACDLTPYVSGQVGTCVVPRAEGDRCKFHWSCRPGLVCADLVWAGFPQAAPAQDGFCRSPSEEGVNCPYTAYAVYVGDQCVAGTGCTAATSKCAPAPRLGEGCAPSQQNCAGASVYCKPTGSGDIGTCTGPVTIGDRCAFAIDATRTVTIPCRTGYCDANGTQACRAPVKQLGAVCASNGECVTNRCAVQEDRTMKCAPAC